MATKAPAQPDRLWFTDDDQKRTRCSRATVRVPDRLRARPAGDGARRSPGPLKLKQRLGSLDAAHIAGMETGELERVRGEACASPLPRRDGATRPGARRDERAKYGGRAERVDGGGGCCRPRAPRARDLPGFSDMKVRGTITVLAKPLRRPPARGIELRCRAIRRSATSTPPGRSSATRPPSAPTRRSSAQKRGPA